MLIRKKRWLIVVALFVLGPVAGLMLGALGGVQLFDKTHDDADEVVVVEGSETDVETKTEGPTVVMPDGTDATLEEMTPAMDMAVVVMKDADCPVCQRQLKRLSDHLEKFERRGGTVVGLSDADIETNRELRSRLDLAFPVVSDTDHELLGELGMTLPNREHVMPGIVFVDRHGEIAEVHEGRKPGQCQERMVVEWFANH